MSQNFVGRKPRLTPEQYARVRQVQAQRRAIPSMHELALELGVPLSSLEAAAYRGVKRYDTQTQRAEEQEP